MKSVLVSLLLLACTPCVFAMDCPDIERPEGKRLTAIISDLHLGVGRNGNQWKPSEDFRWHAALDGFLQRVSACGKGQVDLVIAGDALEMWQPPADIPCKGANADTACTPAEAAALAQRLVNAHRADFQLIGRFAQSGSNRVYFVPGNHDAAVLLDSVWRRVNSAIGAKKGRVLRCAKNSAVPCTQNGWVSQPGGEIYVEHGHQIGSDVNRFASWPDIVRTVDGEKYLQRSWGQRFVQSLFNEQEQHYPIIDNLMPESAGARYRMADRGLWKSVDDVAVFLKFNLLETSWPQKLSELGSGEMPATWNVKKARALGYRLYLDALPGEDPFRKMAERNDAAGNALKAKLTQLAGAESDDEIQILCGQMAILTNGKTNCEGRDLGAIVQRLLVPKAAVMGAHLRQRVADEAPRMRVFVYAHTHQYEPGWDVTLSENGETKKVKVHNTGAFQRLTSEGEFLALAKKRDLLPGSALASLRNEDLKPCYSAVFAVADGQQTDSKTLRWYMDEQGPGEFVGTDNAKCK